jgi:hypothetical protein
MNIKLFELDSTLKNFLLAILFVLTCGVVIGLIYLNQTTNYSLDGATERFNGSEQVGGEDEFAIPENYPKPLQEMLLTTHNHIFGFTFLFFITGIIFYFNSVLTGFWKTFLLVEPILSVLVTFGSIWLMRYIDAGFVYLTIISSVLLYLSFFVMAAVSAYELIFKISTNKA